ncbi:MAG: hypothetical protein WDN50_03500 [Bradyrhizobium sp.]
MPLARDAALVEAGFDALIMPQTTLGIAYTGQIAEGFQDHSVKGDFAGQVLGNRQLRAANVDVIASQRVARMRACDRSNRNDYFQGVPMSSW